MSIFKFYFSVSKDEQAKRFKARETDPLKQYKLSPVDKESQRLWNEYSLAKFMMLSATHTEAAPWTIVKSDDKKRARINCIKHILQFVEYPNKISDKKIKIDVEKRVLTTRYDCIPHKISIADLNTSVFCSQYCCYMGCYISPLEIKFIEKILPDLKPYLPQASRQVLKRYSDEFYLPEDYDPEENLYKTRCSPEETKRFYYDEDVDEDDIVRFDDEYGRA